jgi:hypothetical protein
MEKLEKRGRKKKVTEDDRQAEGGSKPTTPTPESILVLSTQNSDVTMAEADTPSEDTLVETQQLEEDFETQVETQDLPNDKATLVETQKVEEPFETELENQELENDKNEV